MTPTKYPTAFELALRPRQEFIDWMVDHCDMSASEAGAEWDEHEAREYSVCECGKPVKGSSICQDCLKAMEEDAELILGGRAHEGRQFDCPGERLQNLAVGHLANLPGRSLSIGTPEQDELLAVAGVEDLSVFADDFDFGLLPADAVHASNLAQDELLRNPITGEPIGFAAPEFIEMIEPEIPDDPWCTELLPVTVSLADIPEFHPQEVA